MRLAHLILLSLALLISLAAPAQALPIMDFTYQDNAIVVSGSLYVEQIGADYYATDIMGTLSFTNGDGPYNILRLSTIPAADNRIVSFTGPGFVDANGLAFVISRDRIVVIIRYMSFFPEPEYQSSASSSAPIHDGWGGVFTLTDVADVPEPRSAALMPFAIAGLASIGLRRRPARG